MKMRSIRWITINSMARDSGAKIIGGCCGTKPEHLVPMRNAVEANS